ncbi:DNA-processing protein DprA [Nonlabens marinus]|uniref:Rossmann fold nucleotide-binding protein Smf possibly involved in DNA uptake n=1 Tax=Nonlabens marinus S1-08 TaxID=1454201 RepID=W8VZL1_9FLAO|nr:DNA-protecting protein DprA [Nonlabens marinus]BAO54766.1 rossmann fold nucleotide-binding protein Smf possibly involved in DNA uptake [Nonlabens marinus S1-08]
MDQQELLALLALKKAPLIGDIMAKKLIRTFGSATAVFEQPYRQIAAIEGIGDKKAEFIKVKDLFSKAEKELKFIEENNLKYRVYYNDDYPERLQYCVDGPIIFFENGKIDWSNPYTLSIVGTRQITSQGSAFLEKFIAEIAPLKPMIISGYAYGVDILAHKLAIEHGLQTIAVMAHGLNQTYPRNHVAHNKDVKNNGGFVTDFWSTDTFDRKNFLGRNRIIAGLSEATVVIESADKGGSLVTAGLAGDYNREVFAVPGRLNDKYAAGCNDLIKQSKAHMLTKTADIPYILGWQESKVAVQKQLFVELNEDEKMIYAFLKDNEKEMLDIIALNLKMPVHKLASILMSMELKGVVKPLPGKLFMLA